MPLLSCEQHPHLFWMTKEQAITNGRYNGQRNIFFLGVRDETRRLGFNELGQRECSCSSALLFVAGE